MYNYKYYNKHSFVIERIVIIRLLVILVSVTNIFINMTLLISFYIFYIELLSFVSYCRYLSTLSSIRSVFTTLIIIIYLNNIIFTISSDIFFSLYLNIKIAIKFTTFKVCNNIFSLIHTNLKIILLYIIFLINIICYHYKLLLFMKINQYYENM